MAKKRRRYYEELRSIVEEVGGEMWYERKGRPAHGAWVVAVGSKTSEFPWDGAGFGKMDRLYVPKVAEPTHWRDYSITLVSGARAKWLSMIR